MNIIGKRKIFYLISLLFVVPGILSILVFGLKLSPDFTGGSRITISFEEKVEQDHLAFIEESLQKQSIEVISIVPSDNLAIVRTPPIDENQKKNMKMHLKKNFQPLVL
jgi:preprotein translocase subunit SecF